ncbi:hypothetical protein JHL18_03950 [Clostridium sp. YIM B02505]|uniref:Uncharacterized protein n=1 Tax=Clostridium yunnanense TaxID=2800325 RepID=A0ABS1EK97_9CLOT|nr:hypothetical protein [Clostridium yunnanense]MBK1809793.1 hypothetical protein [Clostridium yunnanense]
MKNSTLKKTAIGICFAFAIMLPSIPVKAQTVSQESKLIPLKASNIYDEVIAFYDADYITKASILVDEQDKVPQTQEEKLNQELKANTWVPTMKKEYAPISCYIDLGTEFKITAISYYDTYGISSLDFSSGTPFHWQKIATRQTDSYLNWSKIDLKDSDVVSRYLQIKCDDCNSGISEIAIYGYQVGADPVVKEDNSNNKPNFNITADKFIGINAFIDDPLNVMKVAGTVREYHNFGWSGNDGSKLQISPSAAGGGWNFDEYYRKLNDAGVDVFPCIQGNADYILGDNTKYESSNNKPIKKGADATLPASYYDHASVMYQYAARYGHTAVDQSTLKLAENQEKKTGLGLINYYENANEPNMDWEGRDSYFSPYEFAAMCSADYDGHEGTLGKDAGVKNADKSAKLVMGGLAGSSNFINYVNLMKSWFENNRSDKKFAADVLNFHEYFGNVNPEKADMKGKLSNIVKWRNNNLPDKELWLTEFGWDTNSTSTIAAPSKEAQANWLVRGYLAAMAAGIDRTTMYMLRDANPYGYGNYGSSGLVGEKGSWEPKTSWYYVYTMKDTLKGMVFDKVITEAPNLYIYKFVDPNNSSKECYAVWSPTADGSKIEDYKLNIGNKSKASLVTMDDNYSDGLRSQLNIKDSTVTLEVTERPSFVLVTDGAVAPVEPTSTRIDMAPSSVFSENNEVLEQYKHLVDEQQKLPIGYAGLLKNQLTTKAEALWPLSRFPLTGYIDLGKTYKITHVGFYDSTGQGLMKLTGGTPDSWNKESFLDYDFYNYNSWQVRDVDITTRYIKLDKFDNSECYELAFYGYPIEQQQDNNKNLIKLGTNNVYGNKNVVSSFKALFDEQSLVPTNSTLSLENSFKSNWIELWNLPIIYDGYIDLGGFYDVSNIAFYDSNGVGKLTFYSGEPGKWNKVLEDGLDRYNEWVNKGLSGVKTRYVKIEKENNAGMGEIAFYGTAIGDGGVSENFIKGIYEIREDKDSKIKIEDSMINTEQPLLTSFKTLFDEADKVPVYSDMLLEDELSSGWKPVDNFQGNMKATINLGGKYKITHIGFYDTNGIGSLKVYSGSENNWSLAFEDGLDSYNTWKIKDVNLETQYINLEKLDNAGIGEIAIYGYKIEN